MAVLPPNPSKIGVSSHLSAHVREIKHWPSSRDILSQSCEDVTVFDDELGQLVMDMFLTMETYNGIGLAASQIGVLKNIITISIPMETHTQSETSPTAPDDIEPTIPKRLVLINPEIIEVGEACLNIDEGCLSVPGYYERRARPNRVVVKFQDASGRKQEKELTHIEAFVLQHEIDHLNGKLFIDELSTLKKSRIKKKVFKNMHLIKGPNPVAI